MGMGGAGSSKYCFVHGGISVPAGGTGSPFTPQPVRVKRKMNKKNFLFKLKFNRHAKVNHIGPQV